MEDYKSILEVAYANVMVNRINKEHYHNDFELLDIQWTMTCEIFKAINDASMDNKFDVHIENWEAFVKFYGFYERSNTDGFIVYGSSLTNLWKLEADCPSEAVTYVRFYSDIRLEAVKEIETQTKRVVDENQILKAKLAKTILELNQLKKQK